MGTANDAMRSRQRNYCCHGNSSSSVLQDGFIHPVTTWLRKRAVLVVVLPGSLAPLLRSWATPSQRSWLAAPSFRSSLLFVAPGSPIYGRIPSFIHDKQLLLLLLHPFPRTLSRGGGLAWPGLVFNPLALGALRPRLASSCVSTLVTSTASTLALPPLG